MDPFFDGTLSPMLETNRGCPFKCTFCHEGNDLVTKVNYFPLGRVIARNWTMWLTGFLTR